MGAARWSALALALVCTSATAEDMRPTLNETDIHPEDAFLIDAQCTAVFQIMVDLGTQRGSETVTACETGANFMAAQAINQHKLAFETSQDKSSPVIEDLVVSEHSAYLEGMQSQDQSIAQHETNRFVKDVEFCNLRLRAYDAIFKE